MPRARLGYRAAAQHRHQPPGMPRTGLLAREGEGATAQEAKVLRLFASADAVKEDVGSIMNDFPLSGGNAAKGRSVLQLKTMAERFMSKGMIQEVLKRFKGSSP
ncbi:uncharacterized protein LOC119292007 isoform X1 [Triticum dicoccoides]|uniref:uncharacterized protein LOC119292007 isoform X1 n=1 Tax=Triticum dicoccoides TaxID=85692 RepID=UPI00188E4C20|nr:uncharacterized protein LOC119292007 isoform X1 [Triticum dicoccoides]